MFDTHSETNGVSPVTTHYFTPTYYHTTLGPHAPVLHIAPGDTVITTTVDAMGQDAQHMKITNGPNPQTGPFFVEGAELGDTLVVHFDELTPNRRVGEAGVMLTPNVVDPDYVPQLAWTARTEDVGWQVDLATDTASLVNPEGRLGHLPLPLAPMLGCFGVAPAGGQAISTMTAGPYGGNMDYRGFVRGVTVFLPVFTSGALLFVGDGHALQGDGEIATSGIEISFDVQFTVDLRKHEHIAWPRGENADYIFTVGNARPLEQAVQHATTEMLRWLQGSYGLSAREAGLVLGYCVEYDVGNMYDPAYTMVCKLPKRVLPH
jgi:acetamidase/formamidase